MDENDTSEVCACCRSADWGEGSWGQDAEGTYVCGMCNRNDGAHVVAVWDKAGVSPCIKKGCEAVIGEEACPEHGLPSVLVWLGLR